MYDDIYWHIITRVHLDVHVSLVIYDQYTLRCIFARMSGQSTTILFVDCVYVQEREIVLDMCIYAYLYMHI